MEVVKLAESRGPGFLTSPNTTNSSFNSDLQGIVDGTKQMSKNVEKKLKRLGIEEAE